MPAPTKIWTVPVPARQDPAAPITTSWGNDVWDNMQHLMEWLGNDYLANAAQNHNHDGVNSAKVNIFSGLMPNGSFEEISGTVPIGWTAVEYTGGTAVVTESVSAHGFRALAITSTVLANGGGDATHIEYKPVGAGRAYTFEMYRWASVANVSSRIELIWYDANKNQISISTIINSVNTPTAKSLWSGPVTSPANARFVRTRVTGGVPGSGTAVGTVYFDGGFVFNPLPDNSVGAAQIITASVGQSELGANCVGQSEVKEGSGTFSTQSILFVALSGGAYGFYPRTQATVVPTTQHTAQIVRTQGSFGAAAWIYLDEDGTGLLYAYQTYITASPPNDLGDGEVPLFTFAVVDKLGNAESIYTSSDAPWHYNGPTDIRAHRKDSISGRSWRDVPEIEAELNDLGLTRNEAIKQGLYTPAQFADRLATDKMVEMEITQAIKQADMPIIPHPFIVNKLPGKTVILLDPVSDVTHKLYELHRDGENINQLLHTGKIKFGNTPLPRACPAGVMPVSVTL